MDLRPRGGRGADEYRCGAFAAAGGVVAASEFRLLQVRNRMARTQAGKMFAQAEQFFFTRRPLPLSEQPMGRITLPVHWPQLPLEELGAYGVVEPRR